MYAVFGITKEFARQKALKQAEWFDDENNRYRTQEEYQDEINAITESLFKTLKATQLSPSYANKEEAAKYLRIADQGESRGLTIKRLQQVGFDEVKDKPIIKWA